MGLTEMEVSLSSSLIFCKVAIILGVFPWTHKVSGLSSTFELGGGQGRRGDSLTTAIL